MSSDSSSSSFDETVMIDASSGAPVPRNVELVKGSGPHLSSVTQAVLRDRLRYAAMILCCGFAAFLVLRFVIVDYAEGQQMFVLVVNAVATLVLGACAMMLCRHCDISMQRLRWMELLIFGLPAISFIVSQRLQMGIAGQMMKDSQISATGDVSMVLPTLVTPWLMLIFTYALFIPNTWRRAAVAIGAMCLAPLLLAVFLWQWCPHCSVLIDQDKAYLVTQALVMGVAFAGSLSGVHAIGTLRREAFQAKQMGQYRLGQRIGAGGMGEVFLAEHQMMKRPCAIKLIRTEQAGDPKVLARFEREVQETAKLSHWNSIDIYDYGRTDDGTFYYVMEYLPGLSLQQLVQDHGPLPAERVIHFLEQTCGALAEAHAVGLVHRDIKPANLFAAQRGGLYDVAKLLDFGLAKPMASRDSIELTQEGMVTGSPLYMAPEQASADSDPDERSDIYALGAVGYYLLTGYPPFDFDQPIKVIIAHINKAPRSLAEIQSDVPADLEQVIMRCLSKSPADRYPNVMEMATALERCESAGRWTQTIAQRWWHENGLDKLKQVNLIEA